MDCTKTWFGFITAEIIKQCISLCEQTCPACKNGILSPLLHYHNELNLREKIEKFIGNTAIDLSMLFDQFVIRFGVLSLDRNQFVNLGQSFISISTPDALLYGKYITQDMDKALYGEVESYEPAEPAKKRKKKAI